MRYIFKNIKSFLRDEKTIFFVMVLCILCSALILNFSYGLYQNYQTQKTTAVLELNTIIPEIQEGQVLTRADLEQYLGALSTDTLDQMMVIYTMSPLDGFPEEDFGSMYARFTIHNRKYQICEETRAAFEDNGRLTSGRYFTNEEEETGANVAIVDWNENTLALQSGEDTIILFGKEYQVIGTYDGNVPIVPFLSLPDDFVIGNGFGMIFYQNVTRSQYEELVINAEMVLPGMLAFDALRLPDVDQVNLYNNIIVISVVIALISAINFAMLYLYMIKKRLKDLTIFRLCGCTKSKVVKIYLGECIMISIPVYLIGTGVYAILMHNVLSEIFPYMENAYTLPVYAEIFLIYLISMLITLEIVIRSRVSSTVMKGLQEGRI